MTRDAAAYTKQIAKMLSLANLAYVEGYNSPGEAMEEIIRLRAQNAALLEALREVVPLIGNRSYDRVYKDAVLARARAAIAQAEAETK